MSIQSVPIRAIINFGGVTVVTPYVLSFNVTKVRNSKATFSASLKIRSDRIDNIDDNLITIRAGEKGKENKIFTGYVLSTRPSICFEDPNYTILNISGSDILYKLEGEKFTRRVVASEARWAVIESVEKKAEKGSQFALVNRAVMIIDQNPTSREERKNKNFTESPLQRLGMSNMAPGQQTVAFNFGAIKLMEEK